jgi:uncharacterized protein (UPF0332 family)
MSDGDDADRYLAKALESIAGAQSECANARFNNCANRAYYVSFQAAITALLREGIRSQDGRWPHRFVQAQFAGNLVNRRRLYSATLRRTLSELVELRHSADYAAGPVNWADANRALWQANEFVEAIGQKGRPT